MKQHFARHAASANAAKPIKIDGGNAHAFVFGTGQLTVDRVHFIACNTGITNDLEGPDYNTYTVEDQYLAARRIADKCGNPCVVVAVLDEARASWSAEDVIRHMGVRRAANQPGLLSRILRRTPA